MAANVLLAAFISRGLCHDLLELCERDHEIVVSDHVLTEYERHLKGKFRVPEAKVAEVTALLEGIAEHVEVTALPEPVCRDPDDDWVIATAISGNCRCIVTGDKDLLTLEQYCGIRMLSPRSFWEDEVGA